MPGRRLRCDPHRLPGRLLDEVTALVEWPVPLVCSFEERFLE
ncbi:glycine--tRNA ligase subunit beta, partial [Pseudomonas aeruginosa]|nr:glycine--tRNA ligase subunit beta [Pseudomonas aeruginosa]